MRLGLRIVDQKRFKGGEEQPARIAHACRTLILREDAAQLPQHQLAAGNAAAFQQATLQTADQPRPFGRREIAQELLQVFDGDPAVRHVLPR